MIMRFLRSVVLSLALLAGSLGLLALAPTPVSAQIDTGLNQVGQTIKLSAQDPRVIATNIINVALGLIGIVLVVLILYGGFLYMTSGGQEAKVATAKKVLTNSIIGLVVVLSSWAIARYVITNLLSATQGGGGGAITGTSGSGYAGGFAGGGGAEPFRAKSISPEGSVPLRNVQVKIVFNKAVDPAGSAAITVMKDGGATVAGTVDINGFVATFTPSAPCPAPNADRFCFDANASFVVKLGTALHSLSGQALSCSGFGSICDGAFKTGSIVDTQPPKVSLTYPTNGMSVKANTIQKLQANASDDAGVATVEFLDGSNSVSVEGPTASTTPLTFTAVADWITTSAALGTHTLTAIAHDVDSNTSDRSSVNVIVRPETCFNGKMDSPGETGIDCGGDPSSATYCGACAGGSCTTNADCSSGFCRAGKCVVQPVISTVTPDDGKAGTFVTISGTNFGFSPGTVTFLGAPGAGDDKIASAPVACGPAGSWTNTQVIVEVPVGAANGPIQITNSGSGLSDATNDANGPAVPDFIVDDTQYPGLCALAPNAGPSGTSVNAAGQNFGVTGSIQFSNETQSVQASVDTWSASQVSFKVPVMNIGDQRVTVKTGSVQSNPITFSVLEKVTTAPPVIASIDPGSGPQQQYVTLSGTNFGYSLGRVLFTGPDGSQALGDTSFPSTCSAGFWRDDRIVVKVPSQFTNGKNTDDGKYTVKVQRPDGTTSNDISFSVDSTKKITPGICAIEPSAGPKGTDVKLYGDQFGTEKPFVTFYLGKSAVVSSNSTQQVDTTVPDGSLTGPVSLKVNGVSSNSVNFQVRNCNESPDICGSGEQCCPTGECRLSTDSCGVKSLTAEYSWQTSTGLIPTAPTVIEECGTSATPSPSPWIGRAGGDQAPVDAIVSIRFSRALLPSTVLPSTFRLMKCTSASSEPCATESPVDYTLTQSKDGADQYLVELTPTTNFATGTTYDVKILSTVKADGPDGATMDVRQSCGTGASGETYGYCFRFSTRASSDPSKVGSVDVAPSTYTMTGGGETAPYVAVPRSSADQCIVLNCQKYDWNWYTGTKTSADARAAITNDRSSGGLGACQQMATGLSETLKVPVAVNAEISGTGPAGVGDLYVNFLPPKVESYFPNCQEACSNALVWAQFTSELDDASVKAPGNVEIRKCKNENCDPSELSAPLTLPSGAVDLVPVFGSTDSAKRVVTIKTVFGGITLFEPGAFYHVLLKGGTGVVNGIQGKNGVPMDGANDPQGFAWNFRVKQGADALCTAERVDVSPKVKYETVVGATQVFNAVAFGKPDQCSANGQALIPLSPADWKTGDTTIADIYKIDSQLVDTGADLPPGCDNSCKATGSKGQAGAVAVCGNGVIETTDPNWCAKIGMAGSSKCVTMPAGAAAGEECEPSIFGDLCDPTTCLFKPVLSTLKGGLCGDGKMDAVDYEAGKTCDMGLRCVGGSTSTSTSPVPEYAPCNDPAAKAACIAAGGTCGNYDYRGCSAGCRSMGSVIGKSTCGNGDLLGDGKSCDDGNVSNGDGCSSLCLHEGSSPATTVPAVCGNAILEPGETCEKAFVGQPWSAVPGCDPKTCLHTGTPQCGSPTQPNCCGNGKIDPGEDCDGGPGCSANCLLQGSSASYTDLNGKPSPSFCGNGVLEPGEQCESGGLSSDKVAAAIGYGTPTASISKAIAALYRPQKGNGLADPTQLAFIVGTKTPDPSSNGLISTDVSVTLEGQTGKATYGLQCGLKDENACPAGTGLDQYGCCAPRPQVDFKYPNPNDTNVCRNVLVQGGFNVAMDPSTVINNFEIAEATTTAKCASGTQAVLALEPTYQSGFFGWVHHAWDKLVSFVTGHPVLAELWCKGNVTGQLQPFGSTTSSQLFAFTLDHSLEPNTKYRVRFIGDMSTSSTSDPLFALSDNADPTKKWGVKTQRGVVRAGSNDDWTGPLIWTFTTGDKVCAANTVTIDDVTLDPKLPERPHPFLFVNPNNQPETRFFAAKVQSIQAGAAVPLSTTADYAWHWMPWTSGNDSLVTIESASPSGPSTAADSKQENGTTMLTAGVEIDTDTVNVPPTTSSTVKGVAPVTVLACQHPWPSLDASPFRDAFGSPNFQPGDPFASGTSFYNFSTMYCLDVGNATDTSQLLPSLKINQIPPTISDYAQGILRQYLFTYPVDSALPVAYQGQGLKQDGIGIRILSNPQHLSPEGWYASRGFKGSPQAMLVDGYPAIQDGTSIYVAAANRPQGSTGKIYSNIYLISYNSGAKPITKQIFDQMVKYLTFNINKEFTDQSNVCVNSAGAPYQNTDVNNNLPISCSADWECLHYDPSLHCDSTKLKLVRDTLRMVDFQYLSAALEQAKDPQGKYPTLEGGTYLQSQTNSLWSSWDAQLGKTAALTLPKDPINKFLTCGVCSGASKAPCKTDAECAAGETCTGGSYVGGVWKPDSNIDPQSCWNQSAHTYVCPAIPTAGAYGVSRLYRYEALSGGTRYDIGAEFEIPPQYSAPGVPKLDDWWSPPLAPTRYACNNLPNTSCANSAGTGGDDKLCRPCPNGVCTTCQSGPDFGKFCSASTDCSGAAACGGDNKFPVTIGSCQQVGGTFSYSNICQNVPTGDAGRCGDGVLNSGEVCDAGMTSTAPCTTTTGLKGHVQQICDLKDCQRYITDPAHPQCVADAVCGNGRIDSACVGYPGLACTTSADCPGGAACQAEKCDDGAQNGKYGHCNLTCTGYASYCGDGEISPGEVCDLGAKNGAYCSSASGCTDTTASCSVDCKGPGPYCGDGTVNGPEQCDGNSETTQSAICNAGSIGKQCTTDADCGTGGQCGKTTDTQSCVGVTVAKTFTDPSTGKTTTINYDTQHTRTCNPPGAKDATGASIQCTFNSWSACLAKGTCGDGVVDPGEECDNGSKNSTTGSCTPLCKKNVCGDGYPLIGVEECDNGADNGKVTCSADYGSSCLSCTTSCRWQATAGGYCGDGTKNGPEQCDGTDGTKGVSCQSIGYDFGTTPIANMPSGSMGTCVYDPSNVRSGSSLAAVAAQSFATTHINCTSNADCTGAYLSLITDPVTGAYKFPSAWSVSGVCYANGASCSNTCSYGGCGKCSDTDSSMPKSSITGYVHDAVYSNQPVPNARVTLLYRGVKVSETVTDGDGKYTFDNLISLPVCGAYKIVVDSYSNNLCTGNAAGRPTCAGQPWTTADVVDESLAGGYWPYTSNAFSPSTFAKGIGNESGTIFLLPRVMPYQTLVFVNWQGNLLKISGAYNADIDAHLVLPYSFEGGTYAITSSGSNLHRDVNYAQRGVSDLSQPPYAHLYCFHSNSPIEDCAQFDVAPEVMKYSRKLVSASGPYRFFLNDWNMQWEQEAQNYTIPLNLSVSVVTPDAVTVVTPNKKPQDYCTGIQDGVWYVFSQDALTGDISIQNSLLSKNEAMSPSYQVENVKGADDATYSSGLSCVVIAPMNAILPTSIPAGSGDFTLVASGSGFLPISVMTWNGKSLTTNYIDANTLTATIPGSYVKTAGTASVSVTTAGGSSSAPRTFTITP